MAQGQREPTHYNHSLSPDNRQGSKFRKESRIKKAHSDECTYDVSYSRTAQPDIRTSAMKNSYLPPCAAFEFVLRSLSRNMVPTSGVSPVTLKGFKRITNDFELVTF